MLWVSYRPVVDHRRFGRRLIATLVLFALMGVSAVSQEAVSQTKEISGEGLIEDMPPLMSVAHPVKDYWVLLATGLGVTAGGLLGARLAYLEVERWEGMPLDAGNRQEQINVWNRWTRTGSVAAAVGLGLIVLWGTIRLSEASVAPDRFQ